MRLIEIILCDYRWRIVSPRCLPFFSLSLSLLCCTSNVSNLLSQSWVCVGMCSYISAITDEFRLQWHSAYTFGIGEIKRTVDFISNACIDLNFQVDIHMSGKFTFAIASREWARESDWKRAAKSIGDGMWFMRQLCRLLFLIFLFLIRSFSNSTYAQIELLYLQLNRVMAICFLPHKPILGQFVVDSSQTIDK